mgnify:CR=1 FL=1
MKIRFRMMENCGDLAPRKAHADDAAYDLHSRTDLELEPMTSTLVPTGLFLELPVGYEAQIRPRSGLAAKHAVTVLNTPGTIDAGYRGEVCVLMINHGKAPFEIHTGDRIAQLMFMPVMQAAFLPVDELDETERGTGGFGSTGVN